SAMVSFQRVFEVIDLEPLIQDRAGARALPPGPASTDSDEVTFAYPRPEQAPLASQEQVATLDTAGGEDVLHEVSFRAEPGQTVALVGSSGAGKSTIASLIPRLFDADTGAVRIGGSDVRDLTAASLRETVGMVTQDGHL